MANTDEMELLPGNSFLLVSIRWKGASIHLFSILDHMKKFIGRLLLFSLVFFAYDKLFLYFIYTAPSRELDKRLERIITGKMNKDCIVIGSSRGARNIIASQLEKGTGTRTYNLSYPGSNIEFHGFLLKSLIKFNKKPKTVLLIMDDPEELLPSNSLKFRSDVLYPLAKYDYINEELIARSEKTVLSKMLCLARVNLSNLNLQKKRFKVLDTLLSCGSMPISFQREHTSFSYNNTNQSYLEKKEQPTKVEAFLKIQRLCLENNIKLYLVFCPNYQAPNIFFEKRIRQLTDRRVGFFFYDSSKSIYKDQAYYYDPVHLQTKGAIIFTNELVEFLNEKKNQTTN